jgi:Ca-activated chloride channel homolog
MNAKKLFISVTMLASTTLAACGTPATPQALGQSTQLSHATAAPAATSMPYVVEAPASTQAPAATESPSLLNPQQPVANPTVQAYLPPPTAIAAVQPNTDNPAVNPFISTQADHLSTFALDVDTASYSQARNYINGGALPPADSVRVEEFVNYFKQDYANPPNVAFGLYADGATSPFQKDGTQILRFGVQGYNVPDNDRKPANLTFVIDISGSMGQPNRLELVKWSLQMLVDRLRPSDTVSIVVFGTDAHVLLNPTSGANKSDILNAIYTLHTEGSTNAEAGLNMGYQVANQLYRAESINRVILLSDGVANVGATTADQLLQTIRSYADAGILLTTLGFGMGDYNDNLMEQLADKGDGNYGYIDNDMEARRLLVEGLTTTLQTIALNAKVQVDFNSEVVSYYRLIGYENRAVADSDFRNNAVDAGEIGAGHTVTALYAVILKPGMDGRIATMNLRWEDPTSHQVQEINGDFNTSNMARSFDDASPRYQLDVVVAQFAELLRHSPYAQETNLNDLRVRAERLSAQIPSDPDISEFARLVGQAAQTSGW